MDIAFTPWTKEQVVMLEKRQDDKTKHPYTCECGLDLIPSIDGWYCSKCEYQQTWCHKEDIKNENID